MEHHLTSHWYSTQCKQMKLSCKYKTKNSVGAAVRAIRIEKMMEIFDNKSSCKIQEKAHIAFGNFKERQRSTRLRMSFTFLKCIVSLIRVQVELCLTVQFRRSKR